MTCLSIHQERWQDAAARNPDLAALVATGRDDPGLAALLAALFGNSPFLSQTLIADPQVLADFLANGPDSVFDSLLAGLRQPTATTTAGLMRHLRIAKRRAALLVALADIAGLWPLTRVTESLSAFAGACLSVAVAHLLAEAHGRGDIVLPDPAAPETDSGLAVIGMGKLGACELNYSSDIDLIVLYDDEKVDYRGRRSPQEMFVRLTRDLIRIFEERTEDGYVFRTDLRLRPDPGSTPLALSLLAAETYYESLGQNWERAAMIKARPVAGDLTAGQGFIKTLKPFIWRKHLDFAAIQDIHSIKRQITAFRGGGHIAVAGHNIKLGRGGIREIEFFAQTQQLIHGGRHPGLRRPATCAALAALAEAGLIEPETAADLTDCYGYLRTLEHRMQMIEDRQTQTIPSEPEARRRLAVFMGCVDEPAFAAQVTGVLRRVEGHYARLFENAPPLSTPGNLVFTGAEDDPDTLATIARLGFSDPRRVSDHIRGWHHGRIQATRSTRARELLTELVPTLLSALGRTADPMAAFHRFDAFLAGLPAGVPVFSLFFANPSLLDLLANILGDAPRLADQLSHHPNLMDAVLTPGFFEPLPDATRLGAELDAQLAEAPDFEEVLNATRRFVGEQRFRVGVQTLRNMVEAEQAGRQLTDLADATLACLYPRVTSEFERVYGRVPGDGAALVALGRMGGRAMTATSDLDLILVYDAPDVTAMSDGPKSLAASAYYARLTQRLIAALTVNTNEGVLYDVDMRLRPSGNAGPIATSLVSFTDYHEKQAWTWEHLALSRARVVTGRPALREAVNAVIRRSLTRERDPDQLVFDVAEMRQRIAREHNPDDPWEVKHRRGGLVDIDFVAQYLQLHWAHRYPEILSTTTEQALATAVRLGVLEAGAGETLAAALHLWSAIQQVLRHTVSGQLADQAVPGRLGDVLARAAGATHFEELKATMATSAEQVLALFDQLIDEPARQVAAAASAHQGDETE